MYLHSVDIATTTKVINSKLIILSSSNNWRRHMEICSTK